MPSQIYFVVKAWPLGYQVALANHTCYMTVSFPSIGHSRTTQPDTNHKLLDYLSCSVGRVVFPLLWRVPSASIL